MLQWCYVRTGLLPLLLCSVDSVSGQGCQLLHKRQSYFLEGEVQLMTRVAQMLQHLAQMLRLAEGVLVVLERRQDRPGLAEE